MARTISVAGETPERPAGFRGLGRTPSLSHHRVCVRTAPNMATTPPPTTPPPSSGLTTPDTEVFKNFIKSPLSNRKLQAGLIPGIGPKTVERLEKLELPGHDGHKYNVDTPQKVMGLFCLLNRDTDQFSKLLQRTPSSADGVKEKLAIRISEALYEKTKGFCTDKAPGHSSVNGSGADGTSVVGTRFEREALSTQALTDRGGVVPGLAKKVVTLESRVREMLTQLGIRKLHENESRYFRTGATPSPVQLFGLYLLMGNEEFFKFMMDITDKVNARKVTQALSDQATKMCEQTGRSTTTSSPVRRMPPLCEEDPKQGMTVSTGIILASLFVCAVAAYLYTMYGQDGKGSAALPSRASE